MKSQPELTPKAKPEAKTASTTDDVAVATPDRLALSMNAGIPPSDSLSNRARAYLQRQSIIGMRRAQRTIQRDTPTDPPAVTQPPAAQPAPVVPTVDNWFDTLPKATRVTDPNPKKDTNIKTVLGGSRVLAPGTDAKPGEVESSVPLKSGGTREIAIAEPSMTNADKGFDGTLTAEQKAFVDQVKATREAVDTDKIQLKPYQGKYGYNYNGTTSQDATPKALQDTADTTTRPGKMKQAQQWIWAEMANEGSAASINAYDSQMLTWGRGLGAKTGGLNPTMNALFKNPEIANRFLSIGIAFKNGQWLAVNVQTGAVEVGNSALSIIQTDPHILAAMADIGEGETKADGSSTDAEKAAVKQNVADAQWAGVVGAGTGQVPDFAIDDNWSKEAVQIAAHVTHWGGAYGWHRNKDAYKATTGDITKIVDLVGKLLASTPNDNGSYSVRGGGPDFLGNLSRWGSGKGLAAIKSTYSKAQITDEDISKKADYNGFLIIKESGPDKDKNLTVYLKKLST